MISLNPNHDLLLFYHSINTHRARWRGIGYAEAISEGSLASETNRVMLPVGLAHAAK